MRWTPFCTAALFTPLAALSLPSALPAQYATPWPDNEPRTAELDGFWPSQRMTDLLVQRAAIQAGEKYSLRPDQLAKLQEGMLDRWPRWLRENRAELQPLVNEYLEARLGTEPPTAAEVSQWSERAWPLLQKFRNSFNAGSEELRNLLTPEQRLKFEAELLKSRARLLLLESSLNRWRQGKFEEREWWDPPTRRREQSRAPAAPGPTTTAAATSADGGSAGAATRPTVAPPEYVPPRVAEEFEAWTKYVSDFCDRYQLDRSQRNAADSMLSEMRQRASDHVRLHRDRLWAIEQQLSVPDVEDAVALDNELEELYGPIDRLFRELDERLHRLPTPGQAQRAEAATSGLPAVP
jgi:hypothetical protein